VNLYSASLFPPVLKVEPGDTMRVRLVNTMNPALFSDTAGSHITNLHFHGLAVSPRAPGDEVIHTAVAVDSTYEYRVQLPSDHAQGLFWYHPHTHPGSYGQVKAGMAGVISIGDPPRPSSTSCSSGSSRTTTTR
jgi:FtsP/CotA-like multicopper oxidase with cupredoxin domain